MTAVSQAIRGDGLVQANCLSTDVVGDCVYVTGPRISGVLQVSRIDPRDLSQIPSFGIIIQKSSPTACVVITFGELDGVYTGLTVQQIVWVGLDGRLTQDNSTITALPGSRVSVQPMGVALDSDLVHVNPGAPNIHR